MSGGGRKIIVMRDNLTVEILLRQKERVRVCGSGIEWSGRVSTIAAAVACGMNTA